MTDTTTPRPIVNTNVAAIHPWPTDCYIQGGDRGVVLDHAGKPYRTAFFEAFPNDPDTFLRGEGSTVAEAEDNCWQQYQRLISCKHGPFERRNYTNGAGFCTQCGMWFPKVFDELPPDPDAPKSFMDRLFGDRDPEALAEVLETMAHIDELPEKPAGNG